MGRCCDGRNAYKPIPPYRYLAGLLILRLLHLKFRIAIALRHLFIKRYPNYNTLLRFHAAYFKDTLNDIKQHKGLVIKEGAHNNRVFKLLAAAVVFSFIFFSYLFRFDGPANGYWDTYITAPAVLMTNHTVDFLSKGGEALYRYALPGKLPDNLINKKTYGISSKDQRIGAAIMFAPWFIFFKAFGFRLLFAVTGMLIAVFVFLTMRQLPEKFSVCLFSALAATLNSYILSINTLNPNILGMLFVSLLLWLLIREDTPWFIAGLVYGISGGVRNEGILFLPAVIYKIAASSPRKKKDLLLFILGASITIAPILYWNRFAFGNMLMHPTQFKGLEGFRPVFEHRLLFWRFDFNGMFNYPFYHKIVRTPYFAFPTFLTLPLTITHSFGIMLTALIFSGAAFLFRKRKAIFIFLLIWFLPMYALLSFQENWSELKGTFLLLFLNPLIIFMGCGIEELFDGKRLLKNISKLTVISVILLVAIRFLFFANFNADERWYIRFPRALENGDISYLGDDLRAKREDPAEIALQKIKLTRGNLFPLLHQQKIDITAALGKMAREINQDNIAVVDYWKYIYER